jgi:tetratricopeptide (TPR) repeat protein
VLLGIVGFADEARAGDPAADALFQSGKALMAEGKVTEACEKFEESYKVDPLLGALLNLANCLEKDGRVASAWSRWGEAVELAGRSGDERKSFAEEHRVAIGPRVPKLLISLTGEVGELEVLRDGVAVGRATFNVAIPIDPGAHTIEVVRGDDVLHRQAIDSKEGEKLEVALNATEIAAKPPIGRRAGAPPPPPKKTVAPDETGGSDTQLIAGFVVGGVGLASGVGGFVFGGLALGKKGEADDPSNCTSSKLCSTQGLDAASTAETFAHVSTGLLAGGGALVALGLVLVLTAPTPDASQLEQRSWLSPRLKTIGTSPGAGAVGLDLRGEF